MIYSLFIGRWQPFHSGHKKLMEVILAEGKNVLIAVRDTKKDENNPYSVEDRITTISEAMKEYGDRVKVISIPDIEDVCYGRKVGWGIREIRLEKEVEELSGTKIREQQK